MLASWGATSHEFHDFLVTTGRSEGTARTYISNLSLFWSWCTRHECLPQEVDREAIRSWLAERRQTVSAARAHNDLAALKLFYAFVRDLRLREDDPTENVRVKRDKRLPTEPLHGGELDTLLAVCKDERDRLILLMLAHTGLRISELASLRGDDIDWVRGEIRVIGKGGKERRIAPNPEVLNRLHAFCGMFPSGHLWKSKRAGQPLSAHQIRKILYEIAERAKLEDVHPHRFRALFATTYVEQFGDIQALQGVMGHESIETTARYSEYTRERRGLNQMRSLRFGN